MLKEAPTAVERARVQRAILTVEKILTLQGGRLRIVIITGSGKMPSDTELLAAQALFAAVRRELKGVDIEPIVIKLGTEGDLIGGRG
jgi:hypothetical protein